MGVKLKDIIKPDVINFNEIELSTVIVDGCNLLFKYISKIRKDNNLLFDYLGNPISHIFGFFYFIINLIERKIKPVFIFDGIPPQEKRIRDPVRIKKIVNAWKYYKNLSDSNNKKKLFKDPLFLYKYIIEDLIDFIKKFGLPVYRAPSEGESQASYLVRNGQALGVISEDYDCLVFGCPRVYRNLDFKNNTLHYISLNDFLKYNNITHKQLVDIVLLAGSDYHKGFKGFGIKTALKTIRKYNNFENLVNNYDFNGFDFKSIRNLFLNPVVSNFRIQFQYPNIPVLKEYLLEKNMSINRINKGLKRLNKAFKEIKIVQSKLDQFLS